MKLSFVCYLLAILPICGLAQRTTDIEQKKTNSDAELVLDNVRVSMQRLLRSTDNEYFLSLYMDVLHPNATLTSFKDNVTIQLKGEQKDDQVLFKAEQPSDDSNAIQELKGQLNYKTNVFKSTLVNHAGVIRIKKFEPAFKVKNMSDVSFNFYGISKANHPFKRFMTRIEVFDKANQKSMQILEGFQAFPNSIGYMDVNFDGYYDVVLSDLSEDKRLQDRRFIYWIYDSVQQKFNRAEHYEQIVGFPLLHGDKQHIDFSNGQVYVIVEGILKPVAVNAEQETKQLAERTSSESSVALQGENLEKRIEEPPVNSGQEQANELGSDVDRVQEKEP